MEKPDEILMLEHQQGDQEAVAILFKRYQRPIFNFALRILGNRADAEDVTGDVFLSVSSKKDTYEPRGKFSTWIYTITRNACLTRIRRRKPMFSLSWKPEHSEEEKDWDIPDPGSTPREAANQKDLASKVASAVKALPLPQKEALVLREYQGLSYEEISQVLNCSLEQVKILIFRGRERLKKELPSFIAEEKYG